MSSNHRSPSPGRGRRWLTPLKDKWYALSRSRDPSPQPLQREDPGGDDPLDTQRGTASPPQKTSYEEPVQSINYGTVNNIATATNVIAGPNYGTIVQQTSNDSVDFSQLNDLPSHPDISGLLSDYFPQSRVADEERIRSWINDQGRSELALCVLGRAGAGKSTFARHLSEKLQVDNQLAAAIFFGFAPPQWGIESVVKVIAHQLGRAHPAAVGPISQAIRRHGGPSVPLDVQIEKFILEPIRHLQYSRPLIIMLDALDQWALHPSLAKALACLSTHSTLLRLVVLGRPGLQEIFDGVSSEIHHLSDVPEDVMKDYFNNRFDKVHWKIGSKPDVVSIAQLVTKAGGLFVWAATVCSLLEDEVCCPNPEETLAAILHSRQNIGETDIMATLYHSAITLLFPKPEHQEKLRTYLGAALVLQEPLPVAAFASLTSMNVSLIKKIRSELGALRVGQVSAVVSQQMIYPATSMFHLSFLEYLQSSRTSARIAFTITPSIYNFQLGKASLEELQRALAAPRRDYRSPLRGYAVKYWPTHTALGTPFVTTTSDAEWKATPHSTILQDLTLAQMQEWAQAFLKLVQPDTSLDIASDVGSTGHLLLAISRALSGVQDDNNLTTHAIPLLEMAVKLQHQDAESWYRLGSAYSKNGRSTGLQVSIERAVECCRCAHELRRNSESGPDQAMLLYALASTLADRYDWIGVGEDQDEAIQLHRQALLLRSVGHPDRAFSLNNLGNSLYGRYKVKGSIEDLEDAIHLHREALHLRPPGHHDRPLSINNLALCLSTRYQQTGSYSDVDESIALQQEVLSLTSPPPQRSFFLNNLANSLKDRFDQRGDAADFDESIRLHQEALSLRPKGHPDRAWSLNNVGLSLWFRFERRGSAVDLEQSITMYQEALSLWLPGHPQRGMVLQNLAMAIQSRSKISESIADIEDPIQLLQEVLGLQPVGHSDRPLTLHNLGLAFMTRFHHEGNADDLEEAIAMYQEVLSCWPPGHPDRPQTLNNLGMALCARYNLSDSIQDLEEALATHREALSFHPSGHQERPLSLQHLGDALFVRFEKLGGKDDLEESIKLRRESLEVSPEAHHWVNLAANTNALAWELLSRYELTGTSNDLEESIALARRSLELIPPDDNSNRVNSLDTLAMALRHQQDHLDESVSLSREAVALKPLDWELLQNVGIILFASYQHTQDLAQLEAAISTCQKAIALCPLHKRSKLEVLDAELSQIQATS